MTFRPEELESRDGIAAVVKRGEVGEFVLRAAKKLFNLPWEPTAKELRQLLRDRGYDID